MRDDIQRTDRWEWDAEFEALSEWEGRRQEQARRAGLVVEEELGDLAKAWALTAPEVMPLLSKEPLELEPSPPKPALDPLLEEILARWRAL